MNNDLVNKSVPIDLDSVRVRSRLIAESGEAKKLKELFASERSSVGEGRDPIEQGVERALSLNKLFAGVSLETPVEIGNSDDLFRLMAERHLALDEQQLDVVLFDEQSRAFHVENVKRGPVGANAATIRRILSPALVFDASAIAIVNNHPNSSSKPSGEEFELMLKLKETAGDLNIKLLDHLIVSGLGNPEDEGGDSYTSYCDLGTLKPYSHHFGL